jgi:GTP-binding protein LepA
VEEPIVLARIIARVGDAGSVMELVQRKRGTDLTTRPLDDTKWMFTCKLPWGEVVTDFHDQLKNVTQGYGSVDTTEADPPFAKADLSKVDIQLNGEVVEPLAFVCHKDEAHGEGKNVCKKVGQRNLSFIVLLCTTADKRQIPCSDSAPGSPTKATVCYHYPSRCRRQGRC